MHFQGFWDLVCRFTCVELTETILVTMKLLQIILHILDRGLSMVLVLYYKVKIHKFLDAQRGFCEGNALASRRVQMSPSENWNNYAPKCLHLLTTSLGRLANWHVESTEATIWRNHHPELVDFVNPGMLFEEGRHHVHRILNCT